MKSKKKILVPMFLAGFLAVCAVLLRLAVLGEHMLVQVDLTVPKEYLEAMSICLALAALPMCGVSWLLFWEIHSKKKYLVLPPCIITGLNFVYWIAVGGISCVKYFF